MNTTNLHGLSTTERDNQAQEKMQIFAKRKRKAPANGEDGQEISGRGTDADKAVEELLKLDPSTLNSKQRRMIKRHRERQSSEEKSSECAQEVPDGSEQTNQRGDGKRGSDIEVVQEEAHAEANGTEQEPPAVLKEKPQEDVAQTESDKQNVGVSMDKDSRRIEVLELLERLNSKQKRTLSRQLAREGEEALEEIEKEALRLIEEVKSNSTQSMPNIKKGEIPEDEKESDVTTNPPSKKRKKDWSLLPAEERLRREEQRRLQKEAQKRQERNGNDPHHRHPLNSERRRANRRKPKWQKRKKPMHGHNISGYEMRKGVGRSV
mmetsp:Transcript_27659/g.64084  ORF Transcript_27659/g.64084 Transcript_27659/m.64084 type:complete len:321 (+) Transcript_27659:128-1090(+)